LKPDIRLLVPLALIVAASVAGVGVALNRGGDYQAPPNAEDRIISDGYPVENQLENQEIDCWLPEEGRN